MADILDSNGLTVATYDELLEFLQDSLNEIYAEDGDTINFDSETPDGQFTNILAQIGTDIRQVLSEVYNSFNPDNCQGALQDQRYALNYLFRQVGSYTIQNIDVTVDQTVDLQGLDSNYNDPTASAYTVSDNAGSQWYLIDSVTLTSGTTSLPFRSQNIGLVQPTIGTIQNQVTKVLGVVSVNNSVAPTSLGQNEESDVQFRIRRDRSTVVKAQNNYDAMVGQLLAVDSVTDVKTWINTTDSTDNTGTPAHTLWVIIEGGANSDIANVIYENAAGLPTRGYVSVGVPSVSGQTFNVNFDRANPVSLYIKFDFQLYVPLEAVDTSAIKDAMVENITYALGQTAETSSLTEAAAQAITANGGGGYALNLQISTDGTTWADYIPSASLQNKFVVDATRIDINVIEMS